MNVLSYNIYCRPRMIFWDNQLQRMKGIGDIIRKWEHDNYTMLDVIMFQEVFDNKANKILKEQMTSIGFIFKTRINKKFLRINGGGLIYSRMPIFEQRNLTFKKAHFYNVASAKGVNYAKIYKNGVAYNLFNIHLDSFDEQIRLTQMRQMKRFVYGLCNPPENIIIGGDWNIDLYGEEIYNVFNLYYHYYIPKQYLSDETISPENDWIARRITSKNDPDNKEEMLDFFVTTIKNSSIEVIKLKTSKYKAHDILYSPPFFLNIYSPFKKLVVDDISDHYGVLFRTN